MSEDQEPFVLYLNNKFKPVDKDIATLARVNYPNGRSLFAIIPHGATTKDSRAYPQQRRSYNVNIFGSMNGYLTGSDSLTAARNEMSREAIERFYSVFVLGYTQAGGAEKDLTGDSEDLAWINARTEEEIGYIKSLFVALKEAKKSDLSRDELIQLAHDHADAYTNSLDAVYNAGKLRAQKAKMLTWRLGATEEHCENKPGRHGCLQLNGQRHKASWYLSKNLIPQMPGSSTTCGGYQCLCHLEDDKGDRVTI